MIREDHIMFYTTDTLLKAKEYIKKEYPDKNIRGVIVKIKECLVKTLPDYDSYSRLARAGLLRGETKEFNSIEELETLIQELDIKEDDRVFGRIVVRVL